MNRTIRKIIFINLFVFLLGANLTAQVVSGDSLALIEIFQSTNGNSWTNNSGWRLIGARVGTWYGVQVNSLTRRVTQLNLQNNNLTGALPTQIGSLTGLQTLNLSGNDLGGTLPGQIGNLTALRNLFLANNPRLGGTLPSSIGNLVNLQYFQIWKTSMSGNIPSGIQFLTSLRSLYLATSDFDGPLPAGLGGMKSLTDLGLGGNNYTGSIPAEIGQMSSLQSLSLDNNQLSGPIPKEIGQLGSTLTRFDVSNNLLSDKLPVEIFNLPNVTYFSVENNDLIGEIPPETANLSSVITLSFHNNHFTNMADLGGMTTLQYTHVSKNNLDFGDIEPNMDIPGGFWYSQQDTIGLPINRVVNPGQTVTFFTNAGGTQTSYQWKKDGSNFGSARSTGTLQFSPVKIEDAGVYTCDITNTLATALTLQRHPITLQVEYSPRQLDSLALVDLYNQMDGANWTLKTNWLSTTQKINNWYRVSVSSSTGRVTAISLNQNNLTGVLPKAIGDLDQLENLYLGLNNISGGLPAEMANLTSLRELWINQNDLDQAIPAAICTLPALERLRLEYNKIPGPIPDNIGSLSALWDLSLAENQMTGSLPSSLMQLSNLTNLWISHNQFSGQVPENFGDLNKIKYLYLDNNNFEGPIPGSMAAMTALEELVLEYNQFSGDVPATLTGLTSVKNINFQHNQLVGLPDLSLLASTLDNLYANDNRFTFEDIEPNLGAAGTSFIYWPQAEVSAPVDTIISQGDDINFRINVGGANNQYQWYKNDIPFGITNNTLIIKDAGPEDSGTYQLRITNTQATNLELWSGMIHIEVFQSSTQADSLMLVTFYDSLGGPAWTNKWTLTNHIEDWYGVTMENERVVGLDLSNNNLSGRIPMVQGGLDSIRFLNFSDNELSGIIWPDIGGAPALEVLNLASNTISGPIPASIGTSRRLQEVILNGNNLSGQIPAVIGDAKQLRIFDVGRNRLTEAIPASIWTLANLEALDLSFNEFTLGTLPKDIQNLSKLLSLNLESSARRGTLPGELGSLTNLVYLNLHGNDLIGDIPLSFANLSKLQDMDIADNRFTNLPDLSGLPLNSLYTQINQLTFEDLEPNIGINDFIYSPQDSAGLTRDTIATPTASLTISSNVGGVNNIYAWYHNGTLVDGATSADFYLTQVTAADLGVYSCVVTNSVVTGLTIYTRPVTVRFEGAPIVQTKPATAISTSGAELNGIVNPSGLETTVQFRYSTDQTNWNLAIPSPNQLTGSGEKPVYAEINTLLDNTVYYFYLEAGNSEGNVTGDVLSFTTLTLGSAPTVQTLAPTNVTATGVMFHGYVNPNGLATDACFVLDRGDTLWVEQGQINGTTTIEVTAIINDLDPGTSYQVHLVAENGAGLAEGTIQDFQTLTGGNLPTAITGTAIQITTTGARLQGTVNPNGLLTNVVFEWGTSAGYGNVINAVPNEVNGTGDVAVLASLTALNSGTSYYFRIKASNGDGEVLGQQSSFVTQFAQVALNAPTANQTDVWIQPQFNWSTQANANSYRIQIDKVGNWDQPLIDRGGLESGSWVCETLLDYGEHYSWRMAVETQNTALNWSLAREFITMFYPTQFSLDREIVFSTKSSPDQYKSSDYRLIGIPGASAIPIDDILGSGFGEKWMAYWDNGSAQDYLKKYNEGSADFHFNAGRAFWIIYNGPFSINKNIASAPLSAEKAVEIPVHTGWNLLTNPFDKNIIWQTVLDFNGISGPIHTFNGSYSTASIMEPYKGYYYFNQSGANFIKFPATAQQMITKPVPVEPALSWKMAINLQCAEEMDRGTQLGVAEKARAGIDQFDYRKPRGIGPMPAVIFERPEWDKQYPGFASDVRPPIDGVETWSFKTQTPGGGASVMTFPGLESVPEGHEIYLVDKTRYTFTNLREENQYHYRGVPEISEFDLVIGDAAEVQEKLDQIVPTEFALGKNFPNPFNPVTTISVLLPEASEVTLKIYNMLGQEMITLYQGNLQAGKHFFTWNAANTSGHTLPSGVYIYAMTTAKGQRFADKMVLIK